MDIREVEKMTEVIDAIALRELSIPTLESRGMDRLDFYNLGVLSIAEALQEAYRLGFLAGRDSV